MGSERFAARQRFISPQSCARAHAHNNPESPRLVCVLELYIWALSHLLRISQPCLGRFVEDSHPIPLLRLQVL